MSERKNINKLFQENFENFEMQPNELVWENIKRKLEEKKKKRRILPFWWRLSGVAAALVIGLLVYHKESETLPNNGTTVAHQENEIPKKVDASNSETTFEKNKEIAVSNNEKSTLNAVVANGVTNEDSHLKNTSKFKKSNLKKNSEVVSKTAVATSENNNYTRKINKKSILTSSKKKTAAVAYTKSKVTKSRNKSHFVTSKNAIASAVNERIKTKKSKAESTIPNSNSEKENIVYNTISSEKEKSRVNPNIKSESTLNLKTDSIKVAAVVPNALEELLKEKDSATTITKAKLNRWQLSSNLAPVYFSSTSKGSPLDAKLDTNDKAYTANNTSYGLGVNYVINKKLKVRTGVNVLNIEYTTTRIVYYQNNFASVNGKLNNLNPNAAGSLITIESLNNVRSPLNKISQRSEGSLNQKFGYIEMPLELTYTVLNKKFGIDVIGGMSTMVLNRNEIYLQSQDLNLKIGDANNLNQVHFSGNLGLGLKYGLFKNLDARIEPIIKYQWNTFSNDSGNFKPYIFGVYSGILYSF
ncbi:hypothetical protein [Flavobacterium sp.]|jgi:hypothetical protein|uniref:hypothetical protein n=1 Tax=Flavobacterium sp. TaxID=239 RepID=UPI0037BEFEF7